MLLKRKNKVDENMKMQLLDIEDEEHVVFDDEIDLSLIAKIQSKGGVTFSSSDYINLGSSFLKVINIYEMPTKITDNWMRKITNFEDCITTIDQVAKRKADVAAAINKSILEQQLRADDAEKYTDWKNAKKEETDLALLYEKIVEMGEVIKYVHIRIFVSSFSIEALNKKCEYIMKELEAINFTPSVYLNQGKVHYKSIMQGLKKQNQENNFQFGNLLGRSQVLTSEQIALGNPFHYSALADPTGSFFGFTSSQGSFIFEPFTKYGSRQSAHGIITGLPRFGKSSLLKKLLRQRFEKGDYVRIISSSSEFINIVKEFGGVFLTDELVLNPLEILESSEDDYANFATHISKCTTFYKAVNKEATEELLTSYTNILKEFYHENGFVPGKNKIVGLPSSSYPVFSDFLKYLSSHIDNVKDLDTSSMNEIEKEMLVRESLNYKLLYEQIKKIVDVYGKYFDKKSTITNIALEKIVCVDIENIKQKSDIFIAYMVNILSLFYDNCILHGKKTKKLFDEGKISFDEATKFMILADEAHNYINANMEMVLDMVNVFLREAPKYFGSLWFASHSLADFYPSGNELSSSKMKILFGLTQYKVMFKQLESDAEIIRNVYQDKLSLSHLKKMQNFSRGQCLFLISGESISQVDIWLSKDYEIGIYKGGN